ncbi:ABC transporter substrate-binding protein [Desulfobacula toluolica]|uniref:Predicted ABC transporter, iron(III) dicitrate-binding protein n=1 Tax=Desulfobacula toluolica (strain DSM 7467 / Tol2) TaxID=651182 RepID=K0NBB1_DESTT|nr:ABC transporter substrate-binding protein [Desulfobacula toluolica]CCK81554.1 predicted ABC transporter, iron(III) dicitrate-binding protein [Desulfobacula toluolica Tol2]
MKISTHKFYKIIPYYLILILIQTIPAGVYGIIHAEEIIDMKGRKVMVPDVIRSVYSVSPPATCMVYALAPDLIAALNYPPRTEEKKYMSARIQNLPVIGGWFGQGRTPNLETLLQVHPDIVLVWQWKRSATTQKIEQTLTPLGFPIVYIQIDTLRDYSNAFEFLGKLLNREQRSASLVQYAKQTMGALDSLQAKIPDAKRISVYYAEGAGGLCTDCSASIHAELIPLCCGKNVHVCEAKDVFGMEKISAEQIIQYNPQVIITRESSFYNRIYTNPCWKNIRAVQEHRVFQIPRSPFDWFDRPPSFMRLLGARWLMNKLYPDKYPVDMIEETRTFYRLFLNKALDPKAAAEILYL